MPVNAVPGKMLGARVAKKAALEDEQAFQVSQPKTLPEWGGKKAESLTPKLTGGTCEARDVPVERPVRLVADAKSVSALMANISKRGAQARLARPEQFLRAH